MKRKTFFATLLGAIAAPFIAKSKAPTGFLVKSNLNLSGGTTLTTAETNNLAGMYKVDQLPEKCAPNKIYLVKCEGGFKMITTDKDGNPQTLVLS
jgi:hypothetical protein